MSAIGGMITSHEISSIESKPFLDEIVVVNQIIQPTRGNQEVKKNVPRLILQVFIDFFGTHNM
jgi:hypothetical protein